VRAESGEHLVLLAILKLGENARAIEVRRAGAGALYPTRGSLKVRP